MMWQHLRCGLTAGQVSAGRGGLRAQISSPRRAMVVTRNRASVFMLKMFYINYSLHASKHIYIYLPWNMKQIMS